MNSTKLFSELLDAVQDATGKNDEEIALAVGATPSWISQCRNGKQNAGPKLWRKVEAMLGNAANNVSLATNAEASNDLRKFLSEVSPVASRAGVPLVVFLEKLYEDYGLETAVSLKRERKTGPDGVRQEIARFDPDPKQETGRK